MEREKAVASVERASQARLERLQATLEETSAELKASKQFATKLEQEGAAARRAADTAQAQADKLTLDCTASSQKVHGLEQEVGDLRSQVCVAND